MSPPHEVAVPAETVHTPIRFADAIVPIGFLGTFRKKNHLPCEAGHGYVPEVLQGTRRNRLCQCATERAIKRYKLVGPRAFEKLGEDWSNERKAQEKREAEEAARE